MKKFSFFLMMMLISVFIACDNVSNNSTIVDKKTTEVTETKPSIIGKWYYNSEDDRYYYQFLSNGKVYYRYYQNIGSPTSVLNSFVTKIGNWCYLDEEETKFSVGWDDSIDCWYNIVGEDEEKLIVRRCGDGPVGRGLGNVTNLLKSAKTVAYIVDEEIQNLIGTWFYDETKDGKSISFQTDGICYCKYYQYVGSGTFSSLNGWVSRKGIWHYSTTTKMLSVTMNSEITYSYEIVELTPTTLQLRRPVNTPAGTSIMFSSEKMYK